MLTTIFEDPAIYSARVKYAAFLYDAWRDDIGHNRAIARACQEAQITGQALRVYLPAHNRREKILRNWNMLKMRSWGYSVDLIAKSYSVNRATVGRVIDDFQSRLMAVDKCAGYKIRGRLGLADPRSQELPIPKIENLSRCRRRRKNSGLISV